MPTYRAPDGLASPTFLALAIEPLLKSGSRVLSVGFGIREPLCCTQVPP